MRLEEIVYDLKTLKEYESKNSIIKDDIIKYKSNFNKNSWQYEYLNFLINDFKELLTCSILELNAYKQKYILLKENCICKEENCTVCDKNKEISEFSEKLQKILKYSNEELRNIISKKGLKTCYICNAQYAILVSDEVNQQKDDSIDGELQKREIAKFQIDHYYPKSIYPAFAISLSNLYPICGYCNQIKNNNEYDLNNINRNLKYSLDVESLKNHLSNNENRLSLILNDDSTGDKKISKIFDLKGIYNNHLDEIEELIERKIKYQDSYKDKLVNRFKELTISNKNIENRLILGTYSKEEGFFKRPLSKFIHDINDQLESF